MASSKNPTNFSGGSVNAKAVKIIFILFIVILNIVDMVTAFIGQHQLTESNPIYVLTGSFFWLVIYKISLVIGIVVLVWWNKWKTERYMFVFIMGMVYLSFFLIYGIFTNILVIANPIPPEKVVEFQQAVTTGVKLSSYASASRNYYIRPMILGVISFILFEWLYPNARFRKRRLKNLTPQKLR